MKEKLYTIPLNDAVNAGDECPLCFAERKLEQDAMDFTLGNSSAYMERDIRAMTDEEGFCRRHFKDMYDYGNALGSAWILSTHMRRMEKEMNEVFGHHEGGKAPKMGLFRKAGSADAEATDPVAKWVRRKEASCYVCKQINDTKKRYIETFFYLWQKDEVFREKVLNGKGFCLSHYGDLCEAALASLPEKERPAFYEATEKLMRDNWTRVIGDVDWMIEKFDYQNADKDWKNSRDAIQRGMQKLKGGHPADPAYRMKK